MITLASYTLQGIKYLAIALVPAIVLSALISVIVRLTRRLSGGKNQGYPFGRLTVRIWYLLFVLMVVFAGRPDVFDKWVNLSAFLAYKEALVDFSAKTVLNIILNILLFVPFGFLFAFDFEKLKRSWLVLPLGCLFSLAVELFQLAFSIGIADVDDLINNLLGVVIGYSFYRLIYIARFHREQKGRAALYGLLLALPLLLFGGVYGAYLLQDFGNLQFDFCYGRSLSDCEITFDGSSLEAIDGEIPVYKIRAGTTEEAFELAESRFALLDTVIGEDISYYDDCVVIYNDEHNVVLWYYYDTATYRLDDFFRPALDDSEAGKVTAPEVAEALKKLGFDIPPNSEFRYTGDGRFEFSAAMSGDGAEKLDGSVSCVYYDLGAHNVSFNILKLTPAAELEKAAEEELFKRIRRGDFYPTDETIYMLEGEISSIAVKDIGITYKIDTKGFYRPVYLLNTLVNGESVAMYLTV